MLPHQVCEIEKAADLRSSQLRSFWSWPGRKLRLAGWLQPRRQAVGSKEDILGAVADVDYCYEFRVGTHLVDDSVDVGLVAIEHLPNVLSPGV